MNPRISIDPQVQHGRPVIKGTRIPVIRLLGCLAEGMTIAETAVEYAIPVEDVLAALDFASELVEQAQQRPVAASK
ncbi:MAG TPA: DUF433 domain-containing protein [Thermoanaerobaculia bacterium]|jgi:uncharacterized protein (DUF433 family)|nr:DUF433 domain-containing protein [Thermoanaerobaculia bacterium]